MGDACLELEQVYCHLDRCVGITAQCSSLSTLHEAPLPCSVCADSLVGGKIGYVGRALQPSQDYDSLPISMSAIGFT